MGKYLTFQVSIHGCIQYIHTASTTHKALCLALGRLKQTKSELFKEEPNGKTDVEVVAVCYDNCSVMAVCLNYHGNLWKKSLNQLEIRKGCTEEKPLAMRQMIRVTPC